MLKTTVDWVKFTYLIIDLLNQGLAPAPTIAMVQDISVPRQNAPIALSSETYEHEPSRSSKKSKSPSSSNHVHREEEGLNDTNSTGWWNLILIIVLTNPRNVFVLSFSMLLLLT